MTRIPMVVGGAFVVGGALLVVSGWIASLPGNGIDPPSAAPGPVTSAAYGPQPHNATASQAAEHALVAMFTWRPASDVSAGMALSRAKPWLAAPLVEAADSAPAGGAREVPEWALWRRAADVVAAHARAQQTSDCDQQRCTVDATVTQTVLHIDGTSTPYRVMQVRAWTRHTSEGWRMAGYRLIR
ncbi:hypothetical protein [Nocardia sp. CNY236]|uniref:hypothetical protein n=1 Tax=Nocardia sp. CNY236 TaxID=1169152 RepID=UPI0004905377|nr:hypothetical protein [Nocardia sp. CNY236]